MTLNFTILSGSRKLIKVYLELTLEYCHNCCWRFGCNWYDVCMIHDIHVTTRLIALGSKPIDLSTVALSVA